MSEEQRRREETMRQRMRVHLFGHVCGQMRKVLPTFGYYKVANSLGLPVLLGAPIIHISILASIAGSQLLKNNEESLAYFWLLKLPTDWGYQCFWGPRLFTFLLASIAGSQLLKNNEESFAYLLVTKVAH